MNLIAKLRGYYNDDVDKISTSEGWNLIPEHRKNGNPRKKGRRFGRCGREKISGKRLRMVSIHSSEAEKATDETIFRVIRTNEGGCKDTVMIRIQNYASSGKSWRSKMIANNTVRRNIFTLVKQWKCMCSISNPIDWRFEFFEAEWFRCKSVKGGCIETRTLPRQEQKLNEKSFEMETWYNTETEKRSSITRTAHSEPDVAK